MNEQSLTFINHMLRHVLKQYLIINLKKLKMHISVKFVFLKQMYYSPENMLKNVY